MEQYRAVSRASFLALVVAGALVAGCQDASSPLGPGLVSAAAAKTSNEKFTFTFTFTDVTFPDATAGVIEAGSKKTNKAEFTICSYFTEGYGTYLGQFQSAGFSSADADEVKQFCVDNFADRQ